MSNSEHLIDIFKRSLKATIKSIGKNNEVEIDFVTEQTSKKGKQIKITLPRVSTLKKDLSYIRGETDSIALELRLHDSKIHNKYTTGKKIPDQIASIHLLVVQSYGFALDLPPSTVQYGFEPSSSKR